MVVEYLTRAAMGEVRGTVRQRRSLNPRCTGDQARGPGEPTVDLRAALAYICGAARETRREDHVELHLFETDGEDALILLSTASAKK